MTSPEDAAILRPILRKLTDDEIWFEKAQRRAGLEIMSVTLRRRELQVLIDLLERELGEEE